MNITNTAPAIGRLVTTGALAGRRHVGTARTSDEEDSRSVTDTVVERVDEDLGPVDE